MVHLTMKLSYVLLVLGLAAVVSGRSVPKCKCDCAITYTPLCARDDSRDDTDTFPNSCMLACHNCTSGHNYRVLHQGECSATTTARLPRKRSHRFGRSFW